MARRRYSSKRRNSSSGTKTKSPGTRNGGVSFKSKGQTDFTMNTPGGLENGSAKGVSSDSCLPQVTTTQGAKRLRQDSASLVHRSRVLNSFNNLSMGRDSPFSDEDPVSSSSTYTTSSGTPSSETPSLGSCSLESSRIGTPSINTPSIRTPSLRTPSLFSHSFDNSSFDASSLDYESFDSSSCGTPVTPRDGRPSLLGSSSVSQDESLEERRIRKKNEKRMRYRRNKKLMMLAALHLEYVEKGTSAGSEDSSASNTVTTVTDIIKKKSKSKKAKRNKINELAAEMNTSDKNSETDFSADDTVFKKEFEKADEIVDEGFSENCDKAHRKDVEDVGCVSVENSDKISQCIVGENISITNGFVAEYPKGTEKEVTINVVSIEVEGEIRYGEFDDVNGETERKIMMANGLTETLRTEMEKMTCEVIGTLNERSGKENEDEDVHSKCDLPHTMQTTETGETQEGEDQNIDKNPPDEGEDAAAAASSNEDESSVNQMDEGVTDTTLTGDTSSTSTTTQSSHLIQAEADNSDPKKEKGTVENEKDSKDAQQEKDEDDDIEVVQCTKAKPDEVASVVINDNIHLLNPNDKLEVVDVIETKENHENLVVLEMQRTDDTNKEEKQKDDNDNATKSDDDDNDVEGVEEQVVDIPIIMESGYEEMFPREHVEVVDIMKGDEEGDDDIVIYEVKDPSDAIEDDDVEDESKENEEDEESVATKDEQTSIENSVNEQTAEDVRSDDAESHTVMNGTEVNTDAVNRDVEQKPAGKVDAALAELDSIPDGVCESGEVEEEEEDEEEWSYYRMDPQSHPQSEDVLPGGVPTSDSAPAPLENTDIPLEPSVMVHDKDIAPVPEDKFQDQTSYNFELNKDFIDNLSEIPSQHEPIAKCPSPLEAEIAPLADKKSETFESDMDIDSNFSANTEILSNFPESEFKKANIEPSSPHGSGSPRAPGSPRSVEGFVTSVELNTPDESFATNFAVNQSQDLFAGVVDQPSGPFSVYVSSSPEPASLDPPALASVDLLDMNGGMTNGEEHAPLNQTPQLCEESPVEIVHAQSTVEVVAPPSPVEISGPETQFIPDPSSAPILPADITFVPLPVTEPTAEEPVPVYVDDTPVSEPEVIPDSQIVTDSEFNAGIVIQNTEEVGSESEIQKETNMSFESSQISTEESFTTEMASLTATMAINESTEETKLDESQTPESPRPEVSPVEPVPAIPIHDTALSVDPALITSSLVETEVVCAPTNDIPEVASEVVETLAPAVPAATKATKTAKTPARPAADKAPAKATPNKTTPSRATPGKATPVKTPVTKTPSTRTPTAKTPITKSAEKKTPTPRTTITSSTSRPASAKPAIPKTTTTTRKPLENKSEVSKPTTTKPAARPPSAKLTAIKAAPSTTKAAEKPTTKPAATGAPRTAAFGPTRPRQTLTTKSSAATPAAKKPLTASKSGDKTDSSKLVNGSSSRPSSLSASARSTTTTTARKSLASTKAPAKPAAEKETKNTTNQMLSTRPAKAAPATGRTTTTKMASVHSATRTTSKVSESSSTVKSRVTSTTKSTATKTTGAATKKTLVSKTKASATGAKQTSVKTKTEAAVIDKTEPLVNGENKIADEETSVEVIEKCAVEDIVQASAEMIITETVSASEQVIVSSETTEVLVNGDH